MTIPYNANIPQAGDNPSVSQGQFLDNFGGINVWTGVDHFQFSSGTAGEHKQVSLPSLGTPGSQSGFGSQMFTAAGIADSTSAQLFWKNANSTFHQSPIRAWGLANSSGIIASQSYNSSVSRTTTGNYVVTMPTGTVNGTNYAVLVSQTLSSGFSVGGLAGYSIISDTIFQLNFRALTGGNVGEDPVSFSFQVMQI